MRASVLLLGLEDPQHLIGDGAHPQMLDEAWGVVTGFGAQRYLNRVVNIGQKARQVLAVGGGQLEHRLPGEHGCQVGVGVDVDQCHRRAEPHQVGRVSRRGDEGGHRLDLVAILLLHERQPRTGRIGVSSQQVEPADVLHPDSTSLSRGIDEDVEIGGVEAQGM